jgi:hypothetical protein
MDYGGGSLETQVQQPQANEDARETHREHDPALGEINSHQERIQNHVLPHWFNKVTELLRPPKTLVNPFDAASLQVFSGIVDAARQVFA